MATQPGTLETLAKQIGLALQPLEQQLQQGNIIAFFDELGLHFPPQLLTPAFTSALSAGGTAAGALPGLIASLATAIQNGDEGGILSAGVQLIEKIGEVINAVDQIGQKLAAIGPLPGMNPADVSAFAANFVSHLLGYLLISYLERAAPAAVGIGNLLGILDYVPTPAGDATHPAYTLRQLQLGNLSELLKSPADRLKHQYDWGLGGFDGSKLMPRVATSLTLLGAHATLPSPTEVDTTLLTFKVNSATTPPGLTADLNYPIAAGIDLTLPISGVWSVRLQAQGTFDAGLTATFTPPASVALKPPTGTLNGTLETDLLAKGVGPLILIGQTGGSRLQMDSFSFGAGVSIHWDSTTAIAEPLISTQLTGGKVVIDMSNADGFIATVLGGIHVEAGFELKITWQPDTGIHIEGGAQLELNIPLHLTLGPIALPTLYLIAGASSSGVPIEISVALGLTLGPIQASVDRIGIKALLSFPDHGGNLGPADLAISFKPPNGLGIDIDAGVVAGGGYISFDPDKGQYAGVLDVAIAEIIQVKVIAVLDTILPDGSQGFSFLLIITFDFPPIQLGFGFTLNGVGGLGGVNRTMSIDALHTGFRAHTLDSILFPPDPVANAPQIISNIRSFFPPAEGRYLFGPMLEVGWGTPTLITLAVGVILEVPDPVRIALLGLIDAGLPTEDAALIELHIDILGTLDFGTKTFELDGSLYDSRVLIFSLAGDLLFRLCWGDNPIFIFSLGGFNPHFNTTGLNLPPMHRLSVSIGDGDNPRISANSYFAITSNSLQFGANVEAYAAAAGFSIHGYLGFDVLIIFSPFSFEFDFSAGFDVAFEGVTLLGLNIDGLFSGPRPWHLHGDVSITILFFTVSVSVDLTWGDATPAVLPAKPVLPDLLPALADPRNWSAALPDRTTQAVTLSTPKPDDKTLRVHPMGTLSVRENIVPLDLQIAKYGNATPSDGNDFALTGVQINGHDETKQNFQEYFAAGQFLKLSDADKLSRPSYEKYDAGLIIGSSDVVAGTDSPRTVVYEERYVDDFNSFSRFTRLYMMSSAVHASLIQQGAGYASPVKNSGLLKYRGGPEPTPIATADATYVVAAVDDMAVRSDIASAGGVGYFQARAALDAHLAVNPQDAGNLQIVALHEVGV